jgi:hypothetical protein
MNEQKDHGQGAHRSGNYSLLHHYRVPALVVWPTFNYNALKKYYRLLKHESSLLI